jgi:hypothetical protein
MHRFCVVLVILLIPAVAQFDTHRMEAIESQAMLRQGRAFAVGVGAKLPVTIVGIEEIRRPDGRARFAVAVKNMSDAPVPSYTVGAALVNSDGTVKAWQPLEVVKELKPGQTRRQEILVRVAVPAHTDLLAFAVRELEPAAGEPWKADDSALANAFQKAAQRVAR